jgi:hypothetical protein
MTLHSDILRSVVYGWNIRFLRLLYYLRSIFIVDRVQVFLRTIVNKGQALHW